ncbi:hypothetical protein BD410DRAFT_700179, partial [Rickenella mellea]
PYRGAVYYFPPPWLLIHAKPEISAIYYHNYIRIRHFCRKRVADDPKSAHLTISDWRQALRGDYSQTLPRRQSLIAPSPNEPLQGTGGSMAGKERRAARARVRTLFACHGSIPSYTEDVIVEWRSSGVPFHRVNSDLVLRQEIQWELSELNWRHEFLSLDYQLTDAVVQTEDQRVARSAKVAKVWGGDGSETLLFPDIQKKHRDLWVCTTDSRDQFRAHIQNFCVILADWPDCPTEVQTMIGRSSADLSDIQVALGAAALFYVSSFVRVYNRLPTLP